MPCVVSAENMKPLCLMLRTLFWGPGLVCMLHCFNCYIFQIWNNNTFVDDFLAEARIDVHGDEQGTKKKLELFGRKKEHDQIMPGNLFINTKSSYELSAL